MNNIELAELLRSTTDKLVEIENKKTEEKYEFAKAVSEYLSSTKENDLSSVDKPLYSKEEMRELGIIINEVVKLDTRQNNSYTLEFENEIGDYKLHFCDNIVSITLFKPKRIYKVTRLLKALIEDAESYIKDYNIDDKYIVIRNDDMNKSAIFKSEDGYHFYFSELQIYGS